MPNNGLYDRPSGYLSEQSRTDRDLNWSTVASNLRVVKQFTLLFFLAVSSLALKAQVKEAKISLERGSVSVWLGMPKQEVLKQCVKADYKVSGAGNELEIIDGAKLTASSQIFRVIFENDRVTFASRDWYSSKAKPFDAVLGALEQLDNARGGCSVVHDQDKKPESVWDRVFIMCGFRRVLIESGNVNGISIAAVYEQIDSRDW